MRTHRLVVTVMSVLALVVAGGTARAAPTTPIGTDRTTFFVSPHGDDTGPGTAGRPFRTLEKARDVARSQSAGMSSDIVINVHGGTYRLTRTFELTAADSGRNGHDIVYRAVAGEHPVVSGGSTVSGWTLYDADHAIYRAHVGDLTTRQLFVDGQRAVRARGPINPAGFTKTGTGYVTTDTTMASWRDPSAVEIVSRVLWKQFRCSVSSIDGTAITMREPCWHNANLHTCCAIGQPTWIENAYELLDQPGEWYLDEKAHDLYYIPRPSQSMSTAVVVAPVLQTLVRGTGTASSPLHNVRFEGLTFAETTWLAPSTNEGYADVQSGFRIVGSDNVDFDSTRDSWVGTPSAVAFGYAQHVTLERNRFTNLGTAGISLDTGSQGNRISGNLFDDISSSGIQVGGVAEVDHHPTDPRQITRDNVVTNNVVTRAGAEHADAVGIFVGYTTHTVVEHNVLTDLPYTGITAGWGWGLTDPGGGSYDTPTTSSSNVISHNDISAVMQVLHDGGGIYTLGASPGSVIAGNYIHDLSPNNNGALYLDEGSRFYQTTQNALCNTPPRWLLLHNARDDEVTYNVTDNPNVDTPGSSDLTVARNTTVEDCDVLPASVLATAGLTRAYADLRPGPVPADQQPPSPPGDLTTSGATSRTIQLSWSPSSDAVGVTGYEVDNDGAVLGVIPASANPAITLGGLTPDTSYHLSVHARDAAANLSPARRITVTTASAPQPPGTIPAAGLALWLAADAAAPGPDGTVSLWGDMSAAGNDAFQDRAGSRPTLVHEVGSGQSSVRFDGSSDYLSTAQPVTTSTHYTMIVVDAPTGEAAGAFYNGNSGADGYGLYRVDPTRYGVLHGGVSFLSFGPAADNTTQVETVLRGDDGVVSYYVNGARSGSPMPGAPNPPSGSSLIGAVDTTSHFFHGDVSEVIVYDRALTEPERLQVEQYLQAKYGL